MIPNQAVESFVFVTFRKEGIHKYPEAATNEDLAEVAFLAYPHRHMFHFRVDVEVFHDNRDREFIIEKRWMESLYSTGVLQLDYKSCEMMAEDLYHHLKQRYLSEGRRVIIEVSEDGENGAVVKFPPT